MTPLRFDIFGHGVAVHTADPALGSRVAETLAAYRVAELADPCAAFHLVQRDAESPMRVGRQLTNDRLLIIADRHKLVAASLGALPWQIHIEAFRRSDEYAYYYLFDPLLLMVLKRRGLVHWHGAAVHLAGTDVLIVGEGGAGKSTTTLCLLLHGAAFIADDELFLQAGTDGVRARGAEPFLHCTDATAALLGLAGAPALPLVRRGTRDKRRIDAAGMAIARQARPDPPPPIGAIVFPRVDPDARTDLRPLRSQDVMRRLVLQRPKEHPAVLPDRPSLQRQFVVCALLSETARGFDLVLGGELERLPSALEEALR